MATCTGQIRTSRGRARRGRHHAVHELGRATLCCGLALALGLAACGSESNPGGGGPGAGGSDAGVPTGGSAGAGGAGGAGGIAPPCAHPICDVGDPLAAGCDGKPCVTEICDLYPLCCNWLWAGECVAVVPAHCTGETCQPPANTKFCDQLLNGHASLQFCTSDDTSCTAVDLMPDESCDAFCNKLGVKCGGEKLALDATCTPGGDAQCSDVLQGKTPLCRCTLNCGEGPPCAEGVSCQGGTTCAN